MEEAAEADSCAVLLHVFGSGGGDQLGRVLLSQCLMPGPPWGSAADPREVRSMYR